MVLDARKSIEELEDEWRDCTRCELHSFREHNNAPVLLGGGEGGGIMFIGESPSRDDARRGTVFSDEASRKTLLHAVDRLNIKPVYFTYLLACQSCTYHLDEKGERQTRVNYRRQEEFKLIPQPPAVLPIRECSARLAEEIYIVDPILIVALGAIVASSLSGKSVNIEQDRGTSREIAVPGVTFVPNLSKKKQEWRRTVKGEKRNPVDTFQVRYLMLITHSITKVWDSAKNFDKGNAFDHFVNDLLTARNLHRAYWEEATGVIPAHYEDDLEVERPME